MVPLENRWDFFLTQSGSVLNWQHTAIFLFQSTGHELFKTYPYKIPFSNKYKYCMCCWGGGGGSGVKV